VEKLLKHILLHTTGVHKHLTREGLAASRTVCSSEGISEFHLNMTHIRVGVCQNRGDYTSLLVEILDTEDLDYMTEVL
jgi:hypothetical protein